MKLWVKVRDICCDSKISLSCWSRPHSKTTHPSHDRGRESFFKYNNFHDALIIFIMRTQHYVGGTISLACVCLVLEFGFLPSHYPPILNSNRPLVQLHNFRALNLINFTLTSSILDRRRDTTSVDTKLSDSVFYGSQLICDCRYLLGELLWECSHDHAVENTVMHCRKIESKIGFFQIRPNRSIKHVAAFARINGPIIDTILFSGRIGAKASVWIANYTNCAAGNYSAGIHVYLQDADPEAVLRGESCLDPVFFTPKMFRWRETKNASLKCHSMWSWAKYKNAQGLSKYHLPIRRDFRTAYYSGLRNSVPLFNFSTFLTANPEKRVCLFGDSQLRNVLNSIGVQVTPSTCNAVRMQRQRSFCKVQAFSFHSLLFPHSWEPEYDEILPGCSHVFVNYGQWLSARISGTPWNITRYRDSVAAFMRKLVAHKARHPHLNITWVSTHPYPINERMRTCPPYDWRLPHVISAYNTAARAEARRTRGAVGYLDTHRAILPLFELTFDGTHYQGPIGAAAASLLGHCLAGRCVGSENFEELGTEDDLEEVASAAARAPGGRAEVIS
jgi:hypothetical protein